jgi:acyl-CoA dehydrogenase
MAFGVSEKEHGSDLLANEFVVTESGPDRFIAKGSKYYIGNSNCASMISILARRKNHDSPQGRIRRIPFVLFALRPAQSKGFTNVRKIRTLGVRAGYVGEFAVKDHELPQSDLIAEGRTAWDAVFGTVTLGKFFLGFGSIGICQHAFEEAADHLNSRILYDNPVIEIPHIRLAMAHAYARLTAMKLYAYRTLDYVQSSSATDRRSLLFCAVQKAKVSTEAVKVMALLSECIGAKGFETDTYFEMALRDVQLVPGLEGSTHINLETTAQFIARYFGKSDAALANPIARTAEHSSAGENPYLMQARTGAVHTIGFAHFLEAYRPLMVISNVRLFVKQVKAFELFVRKHRPTREAEPRSQVELSLGHCLATIAYAQLIAENASCLAVPAPIISTIFHDLVSDLSLAAITLASSSQLSPALKICIQRLVAIPQTAPEAWEFVAKRIVR